MPSGPDIPCRHWSAWLRKRFGQRVHKVVIDLGAGCPNRSGLREGGCIFCDERGGGSGAALQGRPLAEQLARGVERAKRRFHASAVLLYFQSYSATYLPLTELKQYVEEALTLAGEKASVVGVAFGTRPDLIPDPVLAFFDDLATRGIDIWLELGVQTTDNEGLRFLRRGHDEDATEDAVKRAAAHPLFLCAHLIAGIPGEAPDQLRRSALRLVSLGVHALKFHPLHVLRGTALERLYAEGRFEPLSLEEYASRVAQTLKALPPETIIQRLSADASTDRLVAPLWMTNRDAVMEAILRRLET